MSPEGSFEPTHEAEAADFYEALQELLRIYQFRDRDTACYGAITPNECYAMEAIERAGAMRITELAAALGLHKSNASRLAATLVARGLVRRNDDLEDPRAARLEMTAKGGAAHAVVRARVQAAHREILDGFPSDLRRQFVVLLSRLAAEARGRIGKHGCQVAVAKRGSK